jgi:hypothetical protein
MRNKKFTFDVCEKEEEDDGGKMNLYRHQHCEERLIRFECHGNMMAGLGRTENTTYGFIRNRHINSLL